MKSRAASAVSNGPSAMVTSTLATLVSVSATMKAVNITHQQSPEIQSARPPVRIFASTARPCHAGRITSRAASVKKLRQKVISKLRACSRCRVTTPAVAHIRVTATISQTARPWVSTALDGGLAAGALALMFLQVALAQAHALGRDLDQLVLLDELHAVFQRQVDRRRDLDRVLLARDPEVGQLLGARGVDDEVVVAAVDADDHAFVHRVIRAHEHAAAIVQLAERVGE